MRWVFEMPSTEALRLALALTSTKVIIAGNVLTPLFKAINVGTDATCIGHAKVEPNHVD